MDGPAHYREAEELLADLGTHAYSDGTEIGLALQALAHATLANAAAAVGDQALDYREWHDAAGVGSPDRLLAGSHCRYG